MRKLIVFVLAAGMLVVATACASASKDKKDTNKEEEKKVCDVECDTADMSEYETMKETKHAFKEITFAQSNTLLNDENFTGIIYYGYPSCPWCIEAVPVMNEVAMGYDLTIYYVNKKSQDSIDHPDEEAKTIEILDQAYGLDRDEETKEPKLYVPEVIAIKNGKIVAHNLGTISGHDAHERKLSEDEARILKTIYENMFNEIRN